MSASAASRPTPTSCAPSPPPSAEPTPTSRRPPTRSSPWSSSTTSTAAPASSPAASAERDLAEVVAEGAGEPHPAGRADAKVDLEAAGDGQHPLDAAAGDHQVAG